MPRCLRLLDVIRRSTDINLWKIDSFINRKPFRCMRTKFPLHYYDQIILILTDVEKYFLDIIYTDSDLLIATWEACKGLPVVISEAFSVEHWEKMKSLRVVVLLGGVTRKIPIALSAEIRLFMAVYNNWVTLQFILLPRKMLERVEEMDELILQYDKLTGLLSCEEEGNVRENVIDTVQKVTGTAAENTATIGIETTATSLGHAAAGVVLAVFVDIAVTASMLARAKVRKDRGKITEQQYKREIRERLFQTGCQFVAGTTGTIVGQIVVPVPVVGAAIGGFVGSLVGLGVSMGVSKIHKVVERAKKRKEMIQK